MPVDRNPVTSIPAQHLRPGTTTDRYHNTIASATDTLVTDCLAGVIPEDIRRDPYRAIGGGEMNLLKWLVVVRDAPTVRPGDAIAVLEGPDAGKYRVQIAQSVPQENLLLATCIKE